MSIEVGARLRQVRKRSGLSQRALPQRSRTKAPAQQLPITPALIEAEVARSALTLAVEHHGFAPTSFVMFRISFSEPVR